MKRSLTVVLATAVHMAMALPCLAEQAKGKKGHKAGPRGGHARKGRGDRGGFMKVLTDEQKAVLKAAHKEAAKAGTPEKKREIMKAAFAKVRESFTDKQKAAMKKAGGHKRHGKGAKGHKKAEGKPDKKD